MDKGTAFSEFVAKNIDRPMGQCLVGVEVGVRDGRNALDLVRYLNILKIYLVDDFKEYQDGTARLYTQEDQEMELQKLIKYTDHVFDKFVLIRQSSKLARDIFPFGTMDFVYIDGNHSYESVKDDLIWWNQVREGGIFGGHDYDSYDGQDVKKAVDEFVKENNLELHNLGGRTNGGGGVEWAIIKPKLE
jgi:hypothetical protein